IRFNWSVRGIGDRHCKFDRYAQYPFTLLRFEGDLQRKHYTRLPGNGAEQERHGNQLQKVVTMESHNDSSSLRLLMGWLAPSRKLGTTRLALHPHFSDHTCCCLASPRVTWTS